MTAAKTPRSVIWHDVECGGYREDLPLWRALVAETGGPVLDVGAGTGRVALELAAADVEVVALDLEPELLEALTARAARRGVSVETIAADARSFDAGAGRFAAVIVPMQTLQLLPDAAARAEFFAAAKRALKPGGLVAIALADALESFDGETDGLPEPDTLRVDGLRYVSLPLAVVDEGGYAAIHRLRQVMGLIAPAEEEHDVIRLARVDAVTLADEAEALGFEALEARRIPATDVYVGSTVVILRG
jgi:SAM-dependent methyltransferase